MSKTLQEYLQKNYSTSSLKSNLYHIKRFTDYYQNKSSEATFKDVLNYIEHLRKNYDLHPKTLGHGLYGVKIYFNYLLEIGKRNDHPCSELYLKDKVSKEIQVDTLYSPEALAQFFESYHIKKKKHLESRNKIIISLLIYQALTVNEITALQVKDIDLDKGEIFIQGASEARSKSPKSRTLPLQSKQILLIYHYLKQDRIKLLKRQLKNQEATTFILGQYGVKLHAHSISKIINENRIKSNQIQPIKIRQSVIANLLKKAHDIRVVQVFAGHRKVSTTLEYRQSELEALQRAIKRYHPLQ